MGMMHFFIKKVLLFSPPFLFLLLIYLITDPFKVIYNYDNYYEDTYVYKNRDFISTEMYLKNSKKIVYDSFIFGSSTALFLPPSVWRCHISTSNEIFSFDASMENIVGIWSKIKYINNTNHKIKNALLVFDAGLTFSKFTNKGHIFMKHYKVFPSSKINFHLESFMSFLNFNFLVVFIHFKISNHLYPYMVGTLDNRLVYNDLVTNEEYFDKINYELRTDSLNYYKKHKEIFKSRNCNPCIINSQINAEHILMLEEIKEIFIKDSTEFRIVITPLYNQIAFNKSDLNILHTIFGERYVFDFSGINKYTKEESNYYDQTHFKKFVGVDLLNEIYK
jgi:hypothetical protein